MPVERVAPPHSRHVRSVLARKAPELVTRHLDIGCGKRPRNPYRRDELHGVDLATSVDASSSARRADLTIEAIPYPDGLSDSVSANDFLEHAPRVLPLPDGSGTRIPFVELMNEIWRVMRPDGLFYGYTPFHPHPAVFQDLTHVNILTRDSHRYFTRPKLAARMCGFHGDFSVVRLLPARAGEFNYEPTEPPDFMRRYRLWRRERRGGNSHYVCEFRANK